MNSDDASTGPGDDLREQRRLGELMKAVTPLEPEVADRQIASALGEFLRSEAGAGRHRRAVRSVAAAAVLGLFAAGGWWAGSAGDDRATVSAEGRPFRGLPSPCASAVGTYLGNSRVGGTDVAVYVELRADSITVRLVDPVSCTEVDALPSPR